MLKIATWNVNSLRVRLPQVINWLNSHQPTLFALQETKCENCKFPENIFTELGYHVIFEGQKSYNGVAILSKETPGDILKQLPGSDDPQKRFIAITIDHNHHPIRLINLYIPNGEKVGSDKYTYKLNWLKTLEIFIAQEIKDHKNIIVVGDFNIAPEPQDVYDPTKWEGRVLFSEPERAHFKTLLSLGFKDAFRLKSQEPDMYSWWDYRTFGFRRNHGLRIDHILINDPLVKYLSNCYIDTPIRGAEQPSDHAPVIIDLSL